MNGNSFIDKIYDEIKKIAEKTAEICGCTVKITSSEYLPPVYNDPKISRLLSESAKRVVGEGGVRQIAPKMSSEDFSDYPTEVPGVFFRIGTAISGRDIQTSAHNNDFVIDESALHFGADTFVQFILDNDRREI